MSSNAAAPPAQASFFRPDAWASRFPHNDERFSIALWGTHPQTLARPGEEISRVALNLTDEA